MVPSFPMTWILLEKIFHRAISRSFSWNKLFLAFPFVALCGLMFVFSGALALNATPWIALSLGFLPYFLSFGILFSLGVIVSNTYERDIDLKDFRFMIQEYLDMMIGVSYLFLPSFLSFLLIWILLGILFLFKEIPGAGEFFSAVFSFASFLLIAALVFICLMNLFVLFFISPASSLLVLRKFSLFKQWLHSLRFRFLAAMIFFVIGIIPLLLVSKIVSYSLDCTHLYFFTSQHPLFIGMEALFVMIPIVILFTPAVLFFFHVATECYRFFEEKI
jgi:hypothetical protein